MISSLLLYKINQNLYFKSMSSINDKLTCMNYEFENSSLVNLLSSTSNVRNLLIFKILTRIISFNVSNDVSNDVSPKNTAPFLDIDLI